MKSYRECRVLKSLSFIVLHCHLPLQTHGFLVLKLSNLHLPLFLQHLQLLNLVSLLVIFQRLSPLPGYRLLLNENHHCLLVLLAHHTPFLIYGLQPLRNLKDLWNFSNFISMCGLGMLPMSSLPFLVLPHQFTHPLRRHQFERDQLFFEEFHEPLIFQILLQTLCSKAFPLLQALKNPSDAAFIRIHETDHGSEYGPNIPARAPGLLMIVCERGTDGFPHLKPAIIGEEANPRRGEGIVLWQFQQSVIETVPVLLFEVVEEKVENELIFPLEEDRGNGLLLDGLQFLLDSNICYLLVHLVNKTPILCQSKTILQWRLELKALSYSYKQLQLQQGDQAIRYICINGERGQRSEHGV